MAAYGGSLEAVADNGLGAIACLTEEKEVDSKSAARAMIRTPSYGSINTMRVLNVDTVFEGEKGLSIYLFFPSIARN